MRVALEQSNTPGGLAPDEMPPSPFPPRNPTLTLKQKNALLQANFRSTQRDVERLNQLVQSLRKEMKKANANVLSIDIVEQAGKIEKLAKKIKNEVKSY